MLDLHFKASPLLREIEKLRNSRCAMRGTIKMATGHRACCVPWAPEAMSTHPLCDSSNPNVSGALYRVTAGFSLVTARGESGGVGMIA